MRCTVANSSRHTRFGSPFLKQAVYAGAALLFLAGCAPRVDKEEGAGSASGQAETSATATAENATQTSAGSTSTSQAVTGSSEPLSIEHRAEAPPAGFKLPYPDALAATDIETGKRGGTFIFPSFGEGPKTFDPVTANETSSTDITGQMFAGLITFDAARQIYTPGLLKEWYMEENKANWILKLRDGAKWSDGQPITADDILFSAQVVYDPNIPNPGSSILQVAGKPIAFEKIDNLTVRAKLAAPTGAFQPIIAVFPLIPKHTLEAPYKAGTYQQALNINVAPEKIVVSGPFRLKQYASGERVILERNPYYFRYDKNGTQLPYLDTLIFTYAPDMDAALLRFMNGEADGITAIRPESVADMRDAQAKGNYTLHDVGPSFAVGFFWFNLKNGTNKSGKPFVAPEKMAWFSQDNFRKASLYALNKEAIINSVLRGMAQSIWTLESPANKFWNNPNVTKYPYNPDKAKAMLDELGYKDKNGDGIREDAAGNPIRFTFITNRGNKVREEVASLLAADWKAVGIDARPQFVDFNTLVTATGDTFDYDACLLGFTGSPHPATGLNVWQSSGRTHFWNPSQSSPATPWEAELDKLSNELIQSLDLAQQRKIYWRMQEIFSEHLPGLPTWTGKTFVAVRNNFGNIKPSAITPELLWNADEIYRKQ